MSLAYPVVIAGPKWPRVWASIVLLSVCRVIRSVANFGVLNMT